MFVIGATALAAGQIVDIRTGEIRLSFDASTDRLLPEGDEDKAYYDYVRRLFGSDETMLVALVVEDVFTAGVLRSVDRITKRIEKLEGVHHVLSLTNAINIIGSENSIEIRPFLSGIPEDPEELARIRQQILENPLVSGNLVSADGRATAMVIQFLDFSDREFLDRGLDAEIVRIAEEEADGAEIWVAGGMYVRAEQIRLQLADLARSLPLILGVLALVLFLSFRTIPGVILPLLAILVALVWTLGVTVWIVPSLNLVTVLIPPLIMVLGISYSVHVVAGYYSELQRGPERTPATALYEGIRSILLPLVLTAFTTCAGFLAMTLSPMQAIVELGLLSVIGIAFTSIAALTVTPAALAILSKPRHLRSGSSHATADIFSRFASRVAAFDLRHRSLILWGAATLFALAITGLAQVRVGVDTIKAFPGDSAVRRDFEAVNTHLEGANQFSVVVWADRRDAFKEPENLQEIERLQEWLEEQPEIGKTTSVVDYLKLVNRGVHKSDPAYFATPDTRSLAGQLLFFGASDELERFIDIESRTVNIVVRATVLDSELMGVLVERIEERLERLPRHLSGRVTGSSILLYRLIDDIILGQAYSIGGALVLIYFILAGMFLSPVTGLVALIPNVLPILVYFGLLGLSGVTLNPSTSLIAPMALGIAIDDTIHYFSHFTDNARRFADEKKASISALRSVGRPITYTTAAICAGFLVLTTSELNNLVQVGALGACTLGVAWLVDLTLTPVLCMRLRVVTLWDTLTLDLGEEPRKSIPAFHGLTLAQTRILALMASIRTVPAGAALIRAGDSGHEVFIVINGALRVWIEREGRSIELNVCRRGDVIGEVGLYYRVRSANVDVVEEARLLQLTQKDLERMARRYPRIAGRVAQNLGEVLAERLWRTTEQVS
jgi:predicted RND superfamily exporter protein